ncbi:MAG: dioxygenase [Planctomycetia bacterium]|nr:dioxygenase [Planctomycetia bacterium]
MKETNLYQGHCVVSDTFDVTHMIVTAIPSIPADDTTLESQLEEALHQIRDCLQNHADHGEIVQQTIFLKYYEDREKCQQFLRQWYGEHLPVNVYVPQAPCEGQRLAMEALLVLNQKEKDYVVEHKRENLLVSRHSGVTWYYAAGQEPRHGERSIYSQSVESFQDLDRALESVGVPFENVIRTWLYLGNITEPAWNELEGETQRYKELNRARSDFFRGIRFFDGMMPKEPSHPVYPASTGIGGNGDTLVMSALAVRFDTPESGIILPLENPQQVSAFDYGEVYSLKSPKFARALLLATEGRGIIFVSGTASITDSESRYENDPVAQTELTLENIAILIEESNLERHGQKGFGCGLNEMAVARVYVKRQEDYPAIREVCERKMPNVPKIYTIADVCRPELLVEIEGIAFTGRKNRQS